jgi:small conductance mechanosensitive channel
LAVLFGIVLFLFLNNWIFNRLQSLRQTGNTFKRIIALLVILGMFAFIFALPIYAKKQLKIVEFLAILLSAAIALSSTTVLGNLIAGIMNSSLKRFRNKDWIKVGDIRGKDTRKSFFHTKGCLNLDTFYAKRFFDSYHKI